MTRAPLALLALAVVAIGACGSEPAAGNLPRASGAPPTRLTDPAALARYLAVPADSLLAAGRERYDREARDSARAVWEVELARARAGHDSVAEARVLMWLGLANWRLDNYAAARRDGEASLALKRKIGLDGELSRSFNALGLLAWNEGRLAEALTLFDSALASARRHDDRAGVARATGNIPLVQIELGQFDEARRGLLAARAAFHAIGDDRGEGNALANLGMVAIRLGDAAGAIPLLTEARRRYGGEYATGEANALGQLATARSLTGDLQQAIREADSGLALARAYGLVQEAAADLEVLVDLLLQAGSPRLALQRLHQADSLDARLGLTLERGINQRRSAAVLLELGDPAAAVAEAERALEIHREAGAEPEVVLDYLQLALARWRQGDSAGARREAELGLAGAEASASAAIRRNAATLAARLALEGGDPRRALRLASRDGSGDDWSLADLRAGASLAIGRLEQAEREGERALALLERERGSLAVGPLRSAYLGSRVAPFSRLVAIHLARHDTAAAFRVAASLPGRALAERLGSVPDSTGLSRAAVGERLLLRAAALESQIDTLSQAPKNQERRAGLRQALEATWSAYEEYLARAAPSPGDRMLGQRAVTLAEVQAQLGAGEALLTTLAGPDRLDLFLVRRDRVLAWSESIGTLELGQRVRVARQLLAGAPQDAYAALGGLDHLLLARPRTGGGLEGITRLYLVAHGPLAALPFAALWDPGRARFLVEDLVLSYLPAAAALAVVPRGEGAAIDQLAVFAPMPESLPGTAREARSIGRLRPVARLRLGPASGEREVRRALERNLPVHLASHGSQNPLNPLFSRILVGRSGGARPDDNGWLEVHEILGLRTRSPLVFLSGCETGLGNAGLEAVGQGSEEASLAQAFLVAGAGTVVATLWRVGDQGAADLAQAFYRKLGVGVTPAEALAAAQREMIRTRAPGWAAYTIWGGAGRK